MPGLLGIQVGGAGGHGSGGEHLPAMGFGFNQEQSEVFLQQFLHLRVIIIAVPMRSSVLAAVRLVLASGASGRGGATGSVGQPMSARFAESHGTCLVASRSRSVLTSGGHHRLEQSYSGGLWPPPW
jgi:hypothetical protein